MPSPWLQRGATPKLGLRSVTHIIVKTLLLFIYYSMARDCYLVSISITCSYQVAHNSLKYSAQKKSRMPNLVCGISVSTNKKFTVFWLGVSWQFEY